MAPMSYVSSATHSHGIKDKDVNLHLLRNGALLKRLDLLVAAANRRGWSDKRTFREELRSLEFWRSVIAECLASFFYVFFVCGCYALNSTEPSAVDVALASGSAMATLVLCFGPISGAHVNPAVTVALTVTRKISFLRMFFYVTAQCGGAIAGTALLYGMMVTGNSGKFGNEVLNSSTQPLQGFGVEALLTFIIVMAVFATLDPYQSPVYNYPSPLIGVAYLSCSLTAMASTGAVFNPARALGPAFVMNKWTNHWFYWGGPLSGAILAGLIYEYVFDSKRVLKSFQDILEDMNQESSLQSNDEECENPPSVTNHLSSPSYTAQNNVYHPHPTYDDYCRSRSNVLAAPYVGGGGPPHPHTNYAQFPPPPPPPNHTDYRAMQSSTYGDSTTSGNCESLYESANTFRPHSSASRNYSSIYGTRTGLKPPRHLDCGAPGSTKF